MGRDQGLPGKPLPIFSPYAAGTGDPEQCHLVEFRRPEKQVARKYIRASVQQDNAASVFRSGFSGLVTSSQTTDKEMGVGQATLILSAFLLWLPKHPSLTSPH